jgi:outer membrane protein TolC
MKIQRGAGLLCAALGLAAPWVQAQSLPELVDGVLRTHPSLRAQQALGDSAKQALESAEWQFYPTPSVGVEQIDPGYADAS